MGFSVLNLFLVPKRPVLVREMVIIFISYIKSGGFRLTFSKLVVYILLQLEVSFVCRYRMVLNVSESV